MRLGLAALLQNEFIVIIFEVMNVAQFVKTLNERVLTDLVLAEKGEFDDRKDWSLLNRVYSAVQLCAIYRDTCRLSWIADSNWHS